MLWLVSVVLVFACGCLDEACNLRCEVRVVLSSITLWDVLFVGLLYYCIELSNSCVNVDDWGEVHEFKLGLCFCSESLSVCSFVVCMCASWKSNVLCGACCDYDRVTI